MKKNDKAVIEQALREALSDTYVLYAKTHAFHWNVEGPLFHQLHVMFEQQYTELWNAIDVVAERLRTIGAYAPHTNDELVGHTCLKEEKKIPTELEMVKKLAADHESVAKRLQKAIPVVQEAGDELTADLFIQRGHVHEKTAWMLRSIVAA